MRGCIDRLFLFGVGVDVRAMLTGDAHRKPAPWTAFNYTRWPLSTYYDYDDEPGEAASVCAHSCSGHVPPSQPPSPYSRACAR